MTNKEITNKINTNLFNNSLNDNDSLNNNSFNSNNQTAGKIFNDINSNNENNNIVDNDNKDDKNDKENKENNNKDNNEEEDNDNNKKVLNGKIYKIINLIINEPCYIGQTILSIKHRFNEHCRLFNNQNTTYLINTYGRQYFKIELIKDNINTKQELDIMEKEYIISYLKQYDLINKVIYKNYEKTSIAIQCIETEEIFPSINIAAKKYNININSISQAIQYGYAIDIKQNKINNSNENNNKNSNDNNDNNDINSDNNNEFLNSQSEVTTLHWKRLDSNDTYHKRIQNEYIIYIIEQKFKVLNNANTDIDTDTNINEKSTDQIISTNQKFKSNAFCIQCIETLEIFSSMNKAAKQYNIHANLISKSIKYGYTAGIDQNNNKLHWKKITNEQYSNIFKMYKYDVKQNNENQYIWKPIYVQQTWKKIWKDQLEFHKNNENSPLYKILNNNDINDFRLIPVQESSLTIIKENIKKFINIKSLNDAIEKEKQLISLLISNSYQLYNFYNNPNYNINDNTDETIVIDINEMLKNYQQEQNQLEQKLLYNNQKINIEYKPIQVQCIETGEIFNSMAEAAQKYNTDLKSITGSIKYGYTAGKIHNANINGKIYNINFHWREYNPKDIIAKNNKYYQIYIIEQKIKYNSISKEKITVKCIETNEIFDSAIEAAQKYNIEIQNIYVAIRYGYATGTDNNGNPLHWININCPIYKLHNNDDNDNDKNYMWIPIYIFYDYTVYTKYNYNDKDTKYILEKYKNDPNCGIYNILNLFPLEDFRLANIKKYKFILTESFISQEKNTSIVPAKFKTCVQCIETKEIFMSLNKAAIKYHTNHSQIKYAIKKGRSTGKDENGNDLHWRIYQDHNNNININNDNNDINNNTYNYCINKIIDKNIAQSVIDIAQKKISKYYNLYNVQLTNQSLINNNLTQNIDTIMWKLVKDNSYMHSNIVYKNVENNTLFLNLETIAKYYRVSIQKLKDILNTDKLITISSTRKIHLISININELQDNTIIYASAYQIIKIQIYKKVSYTITNVPYNVYMTKLRDKNRPGLSQLINSINTYECSIIKSHIYFKEEAENLKSILLNQKPSTFTCKLPVRCITTGEEFSSIEEASKKYGYKGETNILYVCRGQRKYTINQQTREKLKWEFMQKDSIQKDSISKNNCDNNIKTNKSIKEKNNHTVFFLYYLNKLITITSSIHFVNENISLRYKKSTLYSLKYNNTKLKELLDQANIDDFIFKAYKNNLTRTEAQRMIKKLKTQYINEIIT